MACDTKSRINILLKNEIKGNAISYIEEKNRVFIPFNPNSEFIKTLQQAIQIAKAKVLKINEKYNKWANGDVVSLDTSNKEGAYINIHPTQALIDIYDIDEAKKGAEETERQIEADRLYNQSLLFTPEQIEERLKNCA